jgi:hypothetical protein
VLFCHCSEGAAQLYQAFGVGGFAVVKHVQPTSRLLMCGYCHRTYCLHCNGRWHVPEPCTFRANSRSEVEAMVVRLSAFGIDMVSLLPLLGVLTRPPTPPPEPADREIDGRGDRNGRAHTVRGGGRAVNDNVLEDGDLWEIATAKAALLCGNEDDAGRFAHARLREGLELLKHSRCCPNCGAMAHKESGCNKVVCAACQAWFCWLCGAKIPEGSAYASSGHFFSGRCAGLLFATEEIKQAPVTKKELLNFVKHGW